MPNRKRPAVFLDRDGTINWERCYLSDPDDLQLLPGAEQGLSKLQAFGFSLVVVTNQSGIGRGFFAESRLHEIHHRLDRMLKINGVRITRFYYCPHLPSDNCDCRKPKPGMLYRAAEELNLDLGESWMVGDKLIDLQAGRSAGVKPLLVTTGYGKEECLKPEARVIVERSALSLLDAADCICEHSLSLTSETGAFVQ